ncbi:RNA polymerase sigma factor [Nitrosomonas supralitoralis]|uniref:RNA polymerase subunit sigma-24 n=1 Tax=Nitrosomonas supralitoralis TaxID=2116706 RepID=A0A2P7NS01_9PROT|nr:RNA polymerase sigma factor [Nitrosomonas supralitoralis]PSJ16253.1 RNA polymerase subunit sigma-24 [Nitrosomonas supralitoralis]
MNENIDSTLRETLDALYYNESRRVLATLIRLLGDFDLAEDAMHDAFAIALTQWQRDGVPTNPRAWLVSTGRFKAIDRMRRQTRFGTSWEDEQIFEASSMEATDVEDETIEDDRLRLIFTCCHPSISLDAQVALTLRELCNLTTEEVAHAFLNAPATIAQRIVRAKSKIRNANIPYEVPEVEDLPNRLEAVLKVIYLVFNEGYSASTGSELMRHDLSGEAIRLGRLLIELLPEESEALGLLALMLLHDSRRAARAAPNGDLVLLDEQDRSLWNHEQIAEGSELTKKALSSGNFGSYTLQAAIAAVHAEASNTNQIDWAEIVGLYDLLLHANQSPVAELNRAVAVAMRDGPEAGLALVDDLLSRGELNKYHLTYAAQADFYRKLGKIEQAKVAYQYALNLTRQEPERRFLNRRLAELKN